MRKRWTTLAATALVAAAAVAAISGTTIVESASVVLRQSPSSIAPSAGQFAKGASLTVLEDRGTYARVRGGSTEGWLRVADLKPRTFVAPSVRGSLPAGDATAGRATESTSSKGLGDGVNDIAAAYASDTGISPDKLRQLIDQRRELIDSGKVRQFALDGHVGRP